MADTAVAFEALVPATGAKKAATQSADKTKPIRPKTSEMVNNADDSLRSFLRLMAIKEMNKRSRSSLQAIKNYITVNYMIDTERLDSLIKKYLNCATEFGALKRTKGKRASRSLNKKKKAAAKKTVTAKK